MPLFFTSSTEFLFHVYFPNRLQRKYINQWQGNWKNVWCHKPSIGYIYSYSYYDLGLGKSSSFSGLCFHIHKMTVLLQICGIGALVSQESILVLKILLVNTSFMYLIFIIKLRLVFLRVPVSQWLAYNDTHCQLPISERWHLWQVSRAIF